MKKILSPHRQCQNKVRVCLFITVSLNARLIVHMIFRGWTIASRSVHVLILLWAIVKQKQKVAAESDDWLLILKIITIQIRCKLPT